MRSKVGCRGVIGGRRLSEKSDWWYKSTWLLHGWIVGPMKYDCDVPVRRYHKKSLLSTQAFVWEWALFPLTQMTYTRKVYHYPPTHFHWFIWTFQTLQGFLSLEEQVPRPRVIAMILQTCCTLAVETRGSTTLHGGLTLRLRWAQHSHLWRPLPRLWMSYWKIYKYATLTSPSRALFITCLAPGNPQQYSKPSRLSHRNHRAFEYTEPPNTAVRQRDKQGYRVHRADWRVQIVRATVAMIQLNLTILVVSQMLIEDEERPRRGSKAMA